MTQSLILTAEVAVQRCSIQKGILRSFIILKRKRLCQSFNKVAGLRPATLLKKRLWHSCFPRILRNFQEYLFLQNTSGGCFCNYLLPQVTRNEPVELKLDMVYIVIKPKYLIKNLVKKAEVMRWLSCPKLLLTYPGDPIRSYQQTFEGKFMENSDCKLNHNYLHLITILRFSLEEYYTIIKM